MYGLSSKCCFAITEISLLGLESKLVSLLRLLDATLIDFFVSFRKKWAVNYYGKWADDAYTSPVYPHFACGSGYILTRDLVQWLNLNGDYLHHYQGEDVSMGIWLSAIVPKMVQVSSETFLLLSLQYILCTFFCKLAGQTMAMRRGDSHRRRRGLSQCAPVHARNYD